MCSLDFNNISSFQKQPGVTPDAVAQGTEKPLPKLGHNTKLIGYVALGALALLTVVSGGLAAKTLWFDQTTGPANNGGGGKPNNTLNDTLTNNVTLTNNNTVNDFNTYSATAFCFPTCSADSQPCSPLNLNNKQIIQVTYLAYNLNEQPPKTGFSPAANGLTTLDFYNNVMIAATLTPQKHPITQNTETSKEVPVLNNTFNNSFNTQLHPHSELTLNFQNRCYYKDLVDLPLLVGQDCSAKMNENTPELQSLISQRIAKVCQDHPALANFKELITIELQKSYINNGVEVLNLAAQEKFYNLIAKAIEKEGFRELETSEATDHELIAKKAFDAGYALNLLMYILRSPAAESDIQFISRWNDQKENDQSWEAIKAEHTKDGIINYKEIISKVGSQAETVNIWVNLISKIPFQFLRQKILLNSELCLSNPKQCGRNIYNYKVSLGPLGEIAPIATTYTVTSAVKNTMDAMINPVKNTIITISKSSAVEKIIKAGIIKFVIDNHLKVPFLRRLIPEDRSMITLNGVYYKTPEDYYNAHPAPKPLINPNLQLGLNLAKSFLESKGGEEKQ